MDRAARGIPSTTTLTRRVLGAIVAAWVLAAPLAALAHLRSHVDHHAPATPAGQAVERCGHGSHDLPLGADATWPESSVPDAPVSPVEPESHGCVLCQLAVAGRAFGCEPSRPVMPPPPSPSPDVSVACTPQAFASDSVPSLPDPTGPPRRR